MSVDSWKQIALGEEAAVYAYGVLAAQLPDGPERNRAIDLSVAHTRARDRARTALAEQDVDPEVPAAFDIPFPVDSSASARRLAALVESRLVDVYCRQVPEVEPQERAYLATAAAEASARGVSWGGRTAAFPGGSDSEPPEPAASAGSATPAPAGTPVAPPAGSPTATPVAPQGDGAVVQ